MHYLHHGDAPLGYRLQNGDDGVRWPSLPRRQNVDHDSLRWQQQQQQRQFLPPNHSDMDRDYVDGLVLQPSGRSGKRKKIHLCKMLLLVNAYRRSRNRIIDRPKAVMMEADLRRRLFAFQIRKASCRRAGVRLDHCVRA
jgi:hypothetical protein